MLGGPLRPPASKSSAASEQGWPPISRASSGLISIRDPEGLARFRPFWHEVSPLTQKVPPTINLGPFVPSPSYFSLSLSLPPSLAPSRDCCVPLCGVPQPPSLSGRFAAVLQSRGEELIGFVVTS